MTLEVRLELLGVVKGKVLAVVGFGATETLLEACAVMSPTGCCRGAPFCFTVGKGTKGMESCNMGVLP